jgi:sigma-B regulation protein RsbU (phosphoserine phosphatase)
MNKPSVPSSELFNLASPPKLFKISILLVDDQEIVAEAIRRLLADQIDMNFHYCSDPSQALEMAVQVKATVILQDLVMPDCDGLLLVKYFKANPSTLDIPIIVLSAQEDPRIKAEAFRVGANDYVVKLPDKLELIARIQYHSNAYIRLLERNQAYQKIEESQHILYAELAEAASYVCSLLPLPLRETICTNWRFIPSTQLGGDTFGYHWIDTRFFAMYLLDVCGHGVGAALLSVSVVNTLRAQTLPKANFKDPTSVLEALNQAFQMEKQNNMFFTIWYGVYDAYTHQIIYASGGHPPAILLTGRTKETAKLYELHTPGIVIGATVDGNFQNAICQIDLYNRLYIFSDGVYEIQKIDGTILPLQEFISLLIEIHHDSKEGELDSIIHRMQGIQNKKDFVDDFSIVEIKFCF